MSRSLPQIILVLVSAIIVTIVHAQDSTSEVPSVTIRANTRMVVVDVVVTDKKGQPITGLTSSNFTVEENGKKQKIATFTPPGGNQAAPQPLPPGLLTNRAEYLKPAGVPTVLLLDAANSHFLDQAYGRGQMLKYVLEQSETGVPMAVMSLTDRLQVLQDFTSDPRILRPQSGTSSRRSRFSSLGRPRLHPVSQRLQTVELGNSSQSLRRKLRASRIRRSAMYSSAAP